MKSELKKTGLLLLFIALSIFCLYSNNYSVRNIPANLLTNCNSVYRNIQTDIVIYSVNKISIKYKRAITILNVSGENQFDPVVYHFNSDKVKNISLAYYDQNGVEIKRVKRKEFNDYSAFPDFVFFSDTRVLAFNHMPFTYPYTVEFDYEIEETNTIFIPGFNPVMSYRTSVEKSSYSLQNLSGIEVKWKIYNDDNIKIQDNHVHENHLQFYLNDIPAPLYEPLSLELEYSYPSVAFNLTRFNLEGLNGNFNDWNEFGKWYYNEILNKTSNFSDKTIKEIKEIVRDAQSDIERIKILYTYLQTKSRYVAIMLGIGGWKPMPSEDVHKQSYGDCKALTNYMMCMLKVVGINSHYSIIFAGEENDGNIDKSFPKMGGNHAILCVPLENDTIWLECTSQIRAYNNIGKSIENRPVIVIGDDGAKVVRTKKVNDASNIDLLFSAIYLDFNKNEQPIEFECKYEGLLYEDYLHYNYLNSKEIKDKIKTHFSEFSTLEINKIDLNNNKEVGEFEIKSNGTIKNVYKKLGNEILIQAVPVSKYTHTLNPSATRIHPLYLKRGYTYAHTFEYHFNDDFEFHEAPSDILIINSDFGEYSLKFELQEKKVIIHKVLKFNSGTFPKEKYNEYVDFLNKISKADNSKFLISL